MKILFITSFSPYNLSSGGNQRSYLVCKSLCDLGSVDVVCFSHKEEVGNMTLLPTANYLKTVIEKRPNLIHKITFVFNSIFRIISNKCCYAKNKELSAYVQSQTAKNSYDLIFVRYMKTLYATGLENKLNIALDIDDLPHQAFNACVTSLYKWPISAFCKLIESNIHKHFFLIKHRNIYFVSNREQAILPRLIFLPNIPIVSPVDKYLSFEEKENLLLFIGLMEYSANYLSIDHFITHIWPLVKKRVPDAILRIGGRDLSIRYKNKWNKYPDVQILGFVNDIRAEYLRAKIFISPKMIGGGTNIKILEAMKYACPTVATSFSIRGYTTFIKQGYNILIADKDTLFADYCVNMLTDKDLNAQISRNAKLSVNKTYSYANFKDIVTSNIRKIW